MKLVFKGEFKGEEQLPKGALPQNAVRFDEPKTPQELAKQAGRFALLSLLPVAAVAAVSALFFGGIKFSLGSLYFYLGIPLFVLALLPHELLHALCFGKEDVVELYLSLKNGMLFVVCPRPITKARFVFMSLLPNALLGWLPLLVWAVLPYHHAWSNLLFSFSLMGITGGGGDYLNVFNALIQMPKGSMQQLSGFHSYWFLPEE